MKSVAYLIAIPLLLLCNTAAIAEDVPSNEELYQMILEMKQDQLRLKQEAEQARAEANQAQRELEVTKTLLEKTQQELKSTDDKVLRTEEAVAKTQKGLEQTQAEMGTGPSSSVVKAQQSEDGFFANLGVVHKKQEHDRLTYALIDADTPDDQNLTSVMIETSYDTGFKLGGGYLFPQGTEVYASYSQIQTDYSDRVFDPAGGADLQCHLCETSDLNIERDDNLDSAAADYKMRYHVTDFGVAQNLTIGERVSFRLGAGLRYAAIDDRLSALYTDGGDFVDVQRINDFSGFGPRATLDTTWNIGDSGFSIFGSFGSALLVGENDFANILIDNDGDLVLIRSPGEDRLIPMFDAALGAGYTGTIWDFQFDLTAAYEFETWIDALSLASFDDDTDENLFTREDTNLTLHGLFLKAQISW